MERDEDRVGTNLRKVIRVLYSLSCMGSMVLYTQGHRVISKISRSILSSNSFTALESSI